MSSLFFRQLTTSLLHQNHALTLTLPPNRLCPPVPNRFSYILAVQRLLDTTTPSFRDIYDPNRHVIGLDIGCGASCIYPLLACRQRPGWRMLATEIDRVSREYAEENVRVNELSDRIRIVETDPTSKVLIPAEDLMKFERIDFLMTNPPFYSSRAQMLASAKAKSRPPNSSCTGAPVEMIYPYQPDMEETSAPVAKMPPTLQSVSKSTSKPAAKTSLKTKSPSTLMTSPRTSFQKQPTNPSLDSVPAPAQAPKPEPTIDPEAEAGEVLFTTHLLTESQSPNLRHKIQWFTSLLGHLSSLHTIVSRVRDAGCSNYVVWEFIQGSGQAGVKKGKTSKTKRWGIAWSWQNLRPPVDVARGGGSGGGIGGLEKRLLPFPSEYEFGLDLDASLESGTRTLEGLGEKIDDVVSELEIDDDDDDDDNHDMSGIGAQGEGMQWQWKPHQLVGLGMSRHGDCWSRKARRKREQLKVRPKSKEVVMIDADADEEEDDEENPQEVEPALVFKISLMRRDVGVDGDEVPEVAAIHVRWLQGQDSVLFESFCGWLKRKILS